MDVAIVIGHHPDAPGASMRMGCHEIHEHGFWRPFAHELATSVVARDLTPHVIERPNEDPDEALAQKVNETGADAAIELHFNAAGRSARGGTEMIHYPGSEGGEALAEQMQSRTVDALGLENRGLITRRWPFLKLTEMPAVIAEPFFGSNEEDVARALPRLPSLQKAYRHALATFCDLHRAGAEWAGGV